MTSESDEVVVLARGGLADEASILALRVALAIPLGGSRVRLFLAGPAALLGLLDGPQMGARRAQLSQELDSLLHDQGAPVAVEDESLTELGISDRPLWPGVSVVTRAELEDACGQARHCLVF